MQKEKLKRKKKHLEKCGVPYSKRKVKVCKHYGYKTELRFSDVMLRYTSTVSYLDPVSDEKCRCCCCGAEFPIELYHEMKYSNKNNCHVINDNSWPPPSPWGWGTGWRIEETGEPPVKPTRYCYVAEDQIEYISD